MTESEQNELNKTVAEAVKEVVPKTLNEMLSPLIQHQVNRALKPFRVMVVAGYLLGVLAGGLFLWQLTAQADSNTYNNDRQDCVLAGLLRGISPTDDPQTQAAFNAALAQLEHGKECRTFGQEDSNP